MLSERDRRALTDIERRLCADDPALARAFHRTDATDAGTGRRRSRVTVLLVVLGVLIGLPMLLLLPLSVTLMVCGLGAVTAALVRWRRSDGLT